MKKLSSSFLIILFMALLIIYNLVINNRTSKIEENKSITTSQKSTLNLNKTKSDTSINIKYLLGKFNPETDTNFVEIDLKHANRKNLYLQKQTYEAFIKMHDDALKENIKLRIISATRTFDYQKWLWERKWTGKKLVNGKNLSTSITDEKERALEILKYSAMPGTSRHHWGTDIDINSVNNSYFSTNEGKKVYDWLQNNARNYGFCQSYTPKNSTRPTGYEEEKWHWSYFPISKIYLSEYRKHITYEHLTNFKGCKKAKDVNLIEDYVFSINEECK